MFQFQDTIAGDWDTDEFNRRTLDEQYCKTYQYDMNEMALAYSDELVVKRIAQGGRGIEFIAINPMWRSSWKKFWSYIITRHVSSQACDEEAPPAPLSAPPQSPADIGLNTH